MKIVGSRLLLAHCFYPEREALPNVCVEPQIEASTF